MWFESSFFRGTSGSAFRATNTTRGSGSHSHHTLNTCCIRCSSKYSPSIYLAILFYSVFFLLSLELQFSFDLMTNLVNILNPSLFALRPLCYRSLTWFTSRLCCACLRLRVPSTSLPSSRLLMNFLRLLSSGLQRCSSKLIDKFFHIFGCTFSLSSPSLL